MERCGCCCQLLLCLVHLRDGSIALCAEDRGAKREKRSDGGKRDGNTARRDTPRNRKQGEAKGLLKKGKRGGRGWACRRATIETIVNKDVLLGSLKSQVPEKANRRVFVACGLPTNPGCSTGSSCSSLLTAKKETHCPDGALCLDTLWSWSGGHPWGEWGLLAGLWLHHLMDFSF